MKKPSSYLKLGVILMFMVLVISCSKEEASPTNPDKIKSSTTILDKDFVNGIHGKEFVTSQLNSVVTHYNGMTNFANNSGNNNFTGSGSDLGNGNTGTGSFTVHNSTYPIFYGGKANWGDGLFSIYLIDAYAGLSYASNGVIIDFLSPSDYNIVSGTYVYSEENTPFTFNWGEVILNINTEFEEYMDFIAGSITISNYGNSFTVSFNCTLEDGESIIGYYSGVMLDFDGSSPVNGTMSANIGSQLWTAQYINAALHTQQGLLTIYGDGDDANAISMGLNESMVYQGAELNLLNDGINFINLYNLNGFYYADSYAVVNITAYTSSTISGTFEFTGVNDNNIPILVHNGTFTNLTIY